MLTTRARNSPFFICEALMSARLVSIPENQYHADPCEKISLSNSIAKILVDKTPQHAWLKHPRLGGKSTEDEEESNQKFDLGKAAHALLLEGINKMGVVDHPDWRTKEAKNMRDYFRHEGKLPLLRHQFNDVVAMANAAREYLKTLDFNINLSSGFAEQTLIWDEEEDYPKRARLDWISSDRKIVLDYKTTAGGLRYDELARHIEAMGYDIQDAFYSNGVKQLTGKNPKFIFLFQEKEAPYLCQAIELDAGFKYLGTEKFSYAVNLWEHCMSEYGANNPWPGYMNKVIAIEPPQWSTAKWDERIELEQMANGEDGQEEKYRAPVVNGKQMPHTDWLEA